MTLSSIELTRDLVDEMQGKGLLVGSVYEYTNSISGTKLFAVFAIDTHCDIYESHFVKNPTRIWRDGLWLGDYLYLNEYDIDGE